MIEVCNTSQPSIQWRLHTIAGPRHAVSSISAAGSMSLIANYGGGSSSPPTADILFASDFSSNLSSQSSSEEYFSPLVPSSSLEDEPSMQDCNAFPSQYASPSVSSAHYATPVDPATLYASPLSPPVEELLSGDHLSVDHASDPLNGGGRTSPGSLLAGKASRRRRRSPPTSSKFDINDNSLLSVYAFFRNFLR